MTSCGDPLVAETAGFFHGAAEPLAGAIPGKTDIGLAAVSAANGLVDTLATGGLGVAAAAAGLGAVGPGGGGGGGGGGACDFGLGGTSSK